MIIVVYELLVPKNQPLIDLKPKQTISRLPWVIWLTLYQNVPPHIIIYPAPPGNKLPNKINNQSEL